MDTDNRRKDSTLNERELHDADPYSDGLILLILSRVLLEGNRRWLSEAAGLAGAATGQQRFIHDGRRQFHVDIHY